MWALKSAVTAALYGQPPSYREPLWLVHFSMWGKHEKQRVIKTTDLERGGDPF